MRGYTTEGLILKRSNLGEADKLITLFTPQHGKLILRAKSLRKNRSHQASSLQLFNLVKCQVIPSKSPIDLVTQSQLLHSFASWKKHLGRITMAYQLCEIVDKLTPDHQPHPALYQLLLHYLTQISQLDANWKQVSDDWLLHILIELGYWPQTKPFTGDIMAFVESHSERPFHSPKLLAKLARQG